MRLYGTKKTACVSRRYGTPKKAYETAGDAWRAIRRTERTALIPEGALVPYPCPRHGFHLGSAPRHRRGNRVQRGD